MNEDASTYEVPDYILSRLQPSLKLEFRPRDHELAILQYHLPFSPQEILTITVEFLQKAHQLDLGFSVRDGIHLVQYALKRLAQDRHIPCPAMRSGGKRLSKCLARTRWIWRRLRNSENEPSANKRFPGDWVISFLNPMIRSIPINKRP